MDFDYYNDYIDFIDSYTEKNFLHIAIENGFFDLIKAYHENNLLDKDNFLIDLAAKYGRIDIIKFLFFKGYKFSEQGIKWAVQNNHNDVILFFCEQQKENAPYFGYYLMEYLWKPKQQNTMKTKCLLIS
jgi:hypothetical protein